MRNFLTDNRVVEGFQYPRRASQVGSFSTGHPATVGIVLGSVNIPGCTRAVEMEDAGAEGSTCRDCPCSVLHAHHDWNVLVPFGHRLLLLSLGHCTMSQVKILSFNAKGALYKQQNYPRLSKSLFSPQLDGSHQLCWQQSVFPPAHHPYTFFSPGCFPPRSHSSSSLGHSHLAALQERKYSKINLLISCLVCKDF